MFNKLVMNGSPKDVIILNIHEVTGCLFHCLLL